MGRDLPETVTKILLSAPHVYLCYVSVNETCLCLSVSAFKNTEKHLKFGILSLPSYVRQTLL